MINQTSFKRLILRAVLRHVSPMVIRQVSVSDQVSLPEFNDIFCAILGWGGNLGYIFRVHAQEFNSFRRATRCKALNEFRLYRQEKLLYICDTLHMWEWDVQVLDIQEGVCQECAWSRRAMLYLRWWLAHRDRPTGVDFKLPYAADPVTER